MKHDKKKQWLSIGLLTLGAAALAILPPQRWRRVRSLAVTVAALIVGCGVAA